MSTPSVWLTTLGCAKNQVDSEKLAGLLSAAGYASADGPADADVVMVNTCAFIEDARRESVDTILDLDAAKRRDARLVIVGCMAQRYGQDLADAIPEADAVVGIDHYPEIVETVARLTRWQPAPLRTSPMDILHEIRRATPTLPYAYLKVAEGCDKTCTFCAIPSFRGRQVSRPMDEIEAEIRRLASDGVQEVVLVAQDLAAYGRDRSDRATLTDLVRRLGAVEEVRRLRLLYLYPSEIRDGLIEEIAGNEKVASYFDLSLQHAVPRLLRAMARPGGAERYLDLIARIRQADPHAALRSSFIVGFPGESDEDAEALATFLRDAQLDWAGFFPYSPEEGTPAATLDGTVDVDLIGERARYLQDVQDTITARRRAESVGQVVEVLIDQVEDDVAVGRSYREAPEIDGIITLNRGAQGEWATVRITAAYGLDLEGEVIG